MFAMPTEMAYIFVPSDVVVPWTLWDPINYSMRPRRTDGGRTGGRQADGGRAAAARGRTGRTDTFIGKISLAKRFANSFGVLSATAAGPSLCKPLWGIG